MRHSVCSIAALYLLEVLITSIHDSCRLAGLGMLHGEARFF